MPFLKIHIHALEIRVDSLLLRILIVLAIAIPAGFAIHRSYCIFRADRIIRSSRTIESFSKALGYDPGNAVLWWHRGQLHQYSIEERNIEAAMSDYQKALSINPRISLAWVDLALCFENMERYKEAEMAFDHAIETRSYSPSISWQAGNFYLRQGNLPKMYEFFKRATESQMDKLEIAVETAWKIDPDHKGLMNKAVPDNLPSNYAYLSFLIAKSELDLASPVWQRLLKNPIPPDFELKPAMAFSYIDNLLSRNRVSEALQAWDDILRKTETSLVDRAHETLISNGSFENDILRGGFDWRYPDMPEAQFRIDANQRMERLKSMRISFGDANISTDLLSQIAPIYKPGWYILDFYIRSDGLTSDQLPYVVVRGYPNLEGTNARSEQFPSSTDWRKISLPFSVESNCKAVQIALRRDASNKFGNKLKGSLWVDGFKISSSAAK